MPQTSTLSDWNPPLHVGIAHRAYSFSRSAFNVFVTDGPLAWKVMPWKSANTMSDVEGPYYIPGAPSRQVAEGKGAIAVRDQIEKNGPMVLRIRITGKDGSPIPYASLDLWQADGEGSYHFSTFTLRGVVRTDAKGYAEVLTIRPAKYGGRLAHVHLVIRDESYRHQAITTQAYFSTGNDVSEPIRHDLLKKFFAAWGPRVHGWSVPSGNGGVPFDDLPELPPDDVAGAKSVEWWNQKLAELGFKRKVVAIGDVEFSLLPA